MFFSISKFLRSTYAKRLSTTELTDLKFLTKIFPFKVSQYVLDELVDWDNLDDDPIYRLVFPKREMLSEDHWQLLKTVKSTDEEKRAIKLIRHQLNPHPAGQKNNIPAIGRRVFGGIQHKYKETALFFPAQGQTCHAYCTYCFRWAQFVKMDDHKFKSKDQKDLFDYLSYHKEVTNILITGGDPMYMSNSNLFDYLDVIMRPELDHIHNIRIGTKSLAFYPQRFLGDEGDKLLAKFSEIIKKGKNVALMAHFSHLKEFQTQNVAKAVKRLRSAGVIIRTQAPLIKGINDSPEDWRDMWKKSVRMGMIPYYMFVERDTGAHEYFSVPLYKVYRIFTKAYSQVSGLAKTVRGPSMSALPGKVLIVGVTEADGEKKFILKFIQCRQPELINKPFFAKYNEQATWLNELEIESPMNEYIENKASIFEEDNMEIEEVA